MSAPHAELFAVYAGGDGSKLEFIASFPHRGVAERWAETCARDFRRRYCVATYSFGERDRKEPDELVWKSFDPPPLAATLNGKLPAAGSQHAAKTQPGRRRGSNGTWRRDADRLTERGK